MDKTYAGARLRRLREEHRMSQAGLARVLDISPSYLNQMEHDSRPLTVPVLLRLTEAFGVEPGFFSPRDTARLLADLRDALAADIDDGRVTPSELAELAARMPTVAHVLLDLDRRNQALAERLAATTHTRGGEPAPPASRSPHEEVRDFFYRRQNHLPDTDLAAERLAAEIGVRPGHVTGVLAARLAESHGIRLAVDTAAPVRRHSPLHDPADRNAPAPRHNHAPHDDPPRHDQLRHDELHRYDAATRTLHLSGRLRPGQRAFRMATQLALLEYSDDLDRRAAEDFPAGSPAHALARIGIAHYFAAALILPYTAFHAAAEEARYDIERLTDQYGLGYESVCHRLSTLQRPRLRGVPFSFVRVDRAGNLSKSQSANRFHFSRSGGTCPLWNVYEAFAAPGRIHVQVAEMPDGQRYLWTARAVTRHRGGWGEPGRTFAIGLGCEIRHAHRLVYSDGLDLTGNAAATLIGMGCRVCERLTCPQRAAPPLGRTLRIDQSTSTFVPYPVTETDRETER